MWLKRNIPGPLAGAFERAYPFLPGRKNRKAEDLEGKNRLSNYSMALEGGSLPTT